MGFRCSVCDADHEGLPDIAVDKPDHYWDVPGAERDHRIKLTGDNCIIDEHFFIRGLLEIHVHHYPEAFCFGVWVSQKRENFYTDLENFHSSDIGPFFGWLCTRIDYSGRGHAATEDVRVLRGRRFQAADSPGRERPSVVLENGNGHKGRKKLIRARDVVTTNSASIGLSSLAPRLHQLGNLYEKIGSQ